MPQDPAAAGSLDPLLMLVSRTLLVSLAVWGMCAQEPPQQQPPRNTSANNERRATSDGVSQNFV